MHASSLCFLGALVRFEMPKIKQLFWLFVAILFGGCDQIPEMPSFDMSQDNPVRMIVINEGLFTTNTAALSVIYEDGTTYWDVFRYVNQRPLGDVAQSIIKINDYLFVAVNNSRRIEVLEPNTFKSVGSIRYKQTGSPRYITPLSDTTALVSDLYGQLVKIRTVPPYEETEYINLPTPQRGIEQMVTVKGKVFGAYLYHGVAIFDVDKIRVSEMRLLEDLKVSWTMSTCAPLVDYHDRVWFTTFERNRGKPCARMSAIDPESEKVVDIIDIPFVLKDPKVGDIIGMPNYNRVDIDPSRRTMYINLYLCTEDGNKDAKVQTLFEVDVDTHELKEYMKLPGVSMMYGMNLSPEGDVCVCDCLDYSAQRGYIRVYPKGGGDIKSYKVGVYPNRVYFPAKGGSI